MQLCSMVYTEPGTILRIARYKKLAQNPEAAVEEGLLQGVGGSETEPDWVVATRHFSNTAATMIQARRQLIARSKQKRLAQLQPDIRAQ